MLDIFAVILPLFALILWVAAEARKSRLMERDKLNANKFHINLKYLSLDLLSQGSVTQHEATPSFPFTVPYPSLFSRWVGSQDYVLVFLAPLNLITCAFFLILYAIRTTKAELLPASAYFMLVIAYSLIACAAVYAMRVTCRHAESSMIVAVMGTLRALEYMAPLIISEGYELLIARAVLTTWGNFLTIYILTVLPREFLTEDKTKEAYIEEAFSEAGNAADKPPSVYSITRENIIVGLLLLCSLVTSVLVVVPDWHHKLYVMIGFEASIFSSLTLGLVLALITMRKIKGLSQQGVFIGGINTRWLIMSVIIGGVLIRVIYDGVATILSVYNETYVPITSSKAFASWWQETFTLIIPLSFLLSYIVIKATKGKADKSRNAFTHSKRIFCAYLLCLHLMAVGLFLETTKYSFTLSCAFVISLLVATNISLVLFKFVPPISYFCGRTVKSKVDI